MSPGIYLFCLTAGKPLPEPEGTGMDGSYPLLVETIGDLAAIVSEIACEDFSGPGAQAHMEDLAWIGPRAVRHEQVIMTVMQQGPVLPVRFGTVFSSIEALAESLRRHSDALAKFFQEMDGKKEWALRGYVNMPLARSQILAVRMTAEQQQLAGLPPGKRYFLEQRIKGAIDREVASWLKGIGTDIMVCIQEVSAAFVDRRLLSLEVTGRAGEMFFHGALLVADRSVDELRRLTDEWNRIHGPDGLHLELCGPWPPYHFAPILDAEG